MFARSCSLIGAVHLPPLPGSANYGGNMEAILGQALFDALTYKEAGFDALIVENTHDLPYHKGFVDPETVAAMTVVANAVKYETMMPMGVQMLAGANEEALGVAIACGLDFIRVEGFVFAHVADEGIHESCAAKLVRKRSFLQAGKIKIFADVKKKHSSHAITSDVDIISTAQAAESFKADGVVITGRVTGDAPGTVAVQGVKQHVVIPVLVGSGVTSANAQSFAKYADALIVGSDAKFDGDWRNPVDPARAERLVEVMSPVTIAKRH
jgi:membrane complex biogenesis BtpA family protein